MEKSPNAPILPHTRSTIWPAFREPAHRHQSVWVLGEPAPAPSAPVGSDPRQGWAHWLILSVLVVGLLSGMIGGITSASFNTQARSSQNGFASGTVVVGAGVGSGDTLTAANLVPGDGFVSRLTIQSSGTLALRYAMTTSYTGDAGLATALQVTIRAKTSNPCASLDGSVVYGPGSLNLAVIGDPAFGAQTGDRNLNAGASEDLCFAVSFPSSAPTSLQGKGATVTFNFTSEQQ